MKEQLLKLYKQVNKCNFCKSTNNKLQHIHGFGVMNPKLMLILVNPTHRNLSSHPDYIGPRFPFIGVRQFWKVLAEGGLIDKKVTDELPLRADWDNKDTKNIQKELIRNKLFVSNIVKCCYDHSEYPENNVIKDQLNYLSQEIKLVNPKKIVAFSGLVYKTLTGKPVKLSEYWSQPTKSFENISGLDFPVEPCYFPIGRGNPNKAIQVLKRLV